jgi:hypothetical protein
VDTLTLAAWINQAYEDGSPETTAEIDAWLRERVDLNDDLLVCHKVIEPDLPDPAAEHFRVVDLVIDARASAR